MTPIIILINNDDNRTWSQLHGWEQGIIIALGVFVVGMIIYMIWEAMGW